MQFSQKLKKASYPLLMELGRIIGLKAKAMENKQGATPLVSPYELSFETNQGEPIQFSRYKGRFVLITNTASHCGYTAQYADLEMLQQKYPDKLTVLGFPANDFGGQEPGTDQEIAEFCRMYYEVSFPVAKKTSVIGANAHSVYRWLTDPAQNGWNSQAPTWNFCKYLLGPNGSLLEFFSSGVSPMDRAVTRWLEAEVGPV